MPPVISRPRTACQKAAGPCFSAARSDAGHFARETGDEFLRLALDQPGCAQPDCRGRQVCPPAAARRASAPPCDQPTRTIPPSGGASPASRAAQWRAMMTGSARALAGSPPAGGSMSASQATPARPCRALSASRRADGKAVWPWPGSTTIRAPSSACRAWLAARSAPVRASCNNGAHTRCARRR